MSISNLVSNDINSVIIPCNVTGAVVGTSSINLKRLNNLVYLTFNAGTGTNPGGQSTITYTPTITIPSRYAPSSNRIRNVVVSNNGATEDGFVSFSGLMDLFVFVRSAGGNFTGVVSIPDNCVVYSV